MTERGLCVRCRRPLTSSEASGYCDDCDDGKDQIERLQERVRELEEALRGMVAYADEGPFSYDVREARLILGLEVDRG